MGTETKIKFTREYFESLWENLPVEKRAEVIYDTNKLCELAYAKKNGNEEEIQKIKRTLRFKDLDENLKKKIVNLIIEREKKDGIDDYIVTAKLYSNPLLLFEY